MVSIAAVFITTFTGDGSSITDAAICELVSYCPKLRKIRLESCVKLTDISFAQILEKCSDLEALEVSKAFKIWILFFKRRCSV